MKPNFSSANELLNNYQKYQMVDIDGEKKVIDYKLAPIIDYLNQHGVKTLACCQGYHLSDGKAEHHGLLSYILFHKDLKNIPFLFQLFLDNQDIMDMESLPEIDFYLLGAKVAPMGVNYLAKQSQINEQFITVLSQLLTHVELNNTRNYFNPRYN